jgi:hypothetical protein
VADWTVVKAWDHEPEPGSEREFAKSFLVSEGDREFHVTLEWVSRTAVGANAAGHAARRLLTTILENEEPPPRRVLVEPDGSYAVMEPGPP